MKRRRIFALTASAVLAAALLAGCDWLAWLEYLEGQGGSSSSSSSSAVTRADNTPMTASWSAAAARARAAGGLTVTSKDGETFTITGIPSNAKSCTVSAEVAVYHTVTVTSTGSGTVTADGLVNDAVEVEEGQSITITAAPTTGLGADLGYGVATIKIDGEDLPKDEFDSDSHQFTIQVDSDTTVDVGFRKKESIYFYLMRNNFNNSDFSIDANITMGYEKIDHQFMFSTLGGNSWSSFEGILGFDLCIEITGIAAPSGSTTPKYLYITKGIAGTEILDWVELENGRGTLEIQTGDTDTTFSLVATSTQPQTNQTE